MHVHSHGVIGSCVSNLEMPTEATVDRYLQTTTAHYRAPPDHLDSQTPTPTAPDSYDRYTLYVNSAVYVHLCGDRSNIQSNIKGRSLPFDAVVSAVTGVTICDWRNNTVTL